MTIALPWLVLGGIAVMLGGLGLLNADELDEWLEQGDHVRRRFFKQ